MPIFTSYTDFQVLEALEQLQEEAYDLVVLPEFVPGTVTRRLVYPGDVFPPLDYPDNPDLWTNFDSMPLTARPIIKTDLALRDTVSSIWSASIQDVAVTETWSGQEKISRMLLYFVRRFLEYYLNPPKSGYVIWEPRDLTDRRYYVVIENFTIDGTNVVQFASIPHYHSLTVGKIELTLRLISEVV